MTNLHGATTGPLEGVRVADAGEFAAVWNEATPAQREAYVKRMADAHDTALNCVIQDHESLRDQAMRARFLADVEVNRLAQYFYEQSDGRHGFTINIPMVGKEGLVDALKAALTQLGRVQS